MEFNVEKNTKITLELDELEFNTLLCTLGSSTQGEREKTAHSRGIDILSDGDTQTLYDTLDFVENSL